MLPYVIIGYRPGREAIQRLLVAVVRCPVRACWVEPELYCGYTTAERRTGICGMRSSAA